MSSTEIESKPIVSEENEACAFAFQLTTSIVVPMILNTAIEIELFDIISKHEPISAAKVASYLPIKNHRGSHMIESMLRLLASHSILTCSLHNLEDGGIERLYGLAPVAKFFVPNVEHGCSFAPLILLNNQQGLMKVWRYQKDAILDGSDPFAKACGASAFKFNNANPVTTNLFDKAMSDSTKMIGNKVLQTYKGFEGLTSLVDVGGGIGTSLNIIISKYPSIKGINLDLPHVIQNAPPYNGIDHVEGDMFVSIPKGEAIFMKWILHNWDDEHCLKLLRNCYDALPNTGKVIIMDNIMPLELDTTIHAKHLSQLDNIMVTYFGGKERTLKEFEALVKSAGFSEIRVDCCVYTNHIIELYK